MESASEPTQPKYQWRTLILFGLLAIPAALAVLPYSIAIGGSELTAPVPEGSTLAPEAMQTIVLAVMAAFTLGQALLINVPLTALGLLFAKWTGLDAPYIRALLYRLPGPGRFGRALLIGLATGAAAGGLLLVLSQFIFGPVMEQSIAAAGVTLPDIRWSWWEGLLASAGAGFNEEVLLRLFLLNGLAWLGGALFGKKSGRPAAAVLWAANVLSTLVFGALHIPNLMLIGVPVDAATVLSTLAMNGMIGLLFGWLYWRYGLESAIASHFAADVVLKVILVFFL
ncbi:MAG: CPBP family intramembrane metalloprotease [Anaerolineales bacterium]|nr:CPBP family intramembrane metalloprotease [Anaerolineales bacterium]